MMFRLHIEMSVDESKKLFAKGEAKIKANV
jgi:hypothetical protein